MEETRYMISDAAKIVEVEAHVLRYWEEELDLEIGRTELGHRYYTDKNIREFMNIKELKERGLQLKAIKVLLPQLEKKESRNLEEAYASYAVRGEMCIRDRDGDDTKLQIRRCSKDQWALLEADFAEKTYRITYTDKEGHIKIL